MDVGSRDHGVHFAAKVGQRDEDRGVRCETVIIQDRRKTTDGTDATDYFCLAHIPENEPRQEELFEEALDHYQQLMQTKFADMTLKAQAQIYTYLEEYPKAASLYLLLAHKDAEKKEDLLFQAACLQLHFDKTAAIATFGDIVELDGKNVSKAAFNQLNLLFQEKRYKDFILAQDKSLKHVPADKIPLMRYYLGKSLVKTCDYSSAIAPLSKSLESNELDRVQEKNALIALIICAKETQDLLLFDRALVQLKAKFANEEETANILLMHAQLCRDKKAWARSRADIKELLQLSPRHPQREELLYDSALMFTQEGKWQEGAGAFEAFLEEFPQSVQKGSALRHCVNARLEDLKHASPETQKIKQQLLLQSLTRALEEKKTFSPAEKQKMRYLLGKSQFELAQYDEAIGNLSEYARDYHKDPSCVDAYLLLAYSYKQGSQDEIHFVLNAEKALAHNPNLQGAVDLHLSLFNSCLKLAEKAHSNEKAEMISKAAGHLFLALDKPPSRENQRWLAGYYYQHYQNGHSDAAQRASMVLEKLLGMNEGSVVLSIDAQNLEMEGEAIKLASIYDKTGRFNERAQLLESLISTQRTSPDLKWKYQRMAQFELGKTYQALGVKEKALKAYADLIASSSHTSSYFAIAAELEKAKLEFSMLSNMQRSEDTQAVIAICDALKSVQIKRKLHSEPLHLEAALCYVDIKTQLAAPKEQLSRRYFLLEQMKENFCSEKDPLVSQYLSASAQFPDKERLYRQYLAYVDAEMLRVDAEKNQSEMQKREAKQKFDQLLIDSTDDTLKQRIHDSIGAL